MQDQVKPPLLIAEELGSRLKQARLNKNFTQQEVAEYVGVARKTIVEAEKGNARLEAFIAIMQVLGLVDQLDLFLPTQEISPIQLAKLRRKQRQRARGAIDKEHLPPRW